ncbi:unnamed protein product, partial [Darwinula stevensoni]
SGKFLNNEKKSSQEARVTLQYKSTSHFESLTMEQLRTDAIEFPDLFYKDIATHVVTGIVYGADANFVFGKKVGSSETVREVEGKMNAVIGKINGAFSAEGNASVNLNEEEREGTTHFHCKYHGDLLLPKNPTTFQDCIDLYKLLPTLSSQENSVPKWVHLYPLHKLDNRAVQIIREISMGIVQDIEGILEALQAAKVRANDLADSIVSHHFSGIRVQMATFKSLVDRFKTNFQKRILPQLKSVRGCLDEETSLSKIIQESIESPFNKEKLYIWLAEKETETKILERYLEFFKGATLAFAPGDFFNVIHDMKITHAVSFVFQVTPKTDEYLEQMTQFVDGKMDGFSLKQDIQTFWYKDKKIIEALQTNARHFMEFLNANESHSHLKFVVTEYQLREKIHDIVLYERGVPRSFVPPGKPGVPKLIKVTHNSIHFNWKPPLCGSENLEKYEVLYKSTEANDSWKEHTIHKKREKVVISSLTHSLSTMEELEQEEKVLEKYKAQIEANKEFRYKVKETHQRQIDLAAGEYVTNCLTCNRTCHFPGGIADDGDKKNCAAMTEDVTCEICPNKCEWHRHRNNQYRFELVEVEVERTSEDLKKRLNAGTKGKWRTKKMINKLKEEIKREENQFRSKVFRAHACIKRLDEIALKPDPLTILDYIDLLIQSEKQEKKPGFSDKVAMLYKQREHIALLQQVRKGENPFDKGLGSTA